jgi:glycosyltransferase involved in cell wall biosynthesis
VHVVVCTDSRGVGGAEISLANLVAALGPALRVDVLRRRRGGGGARRGGASRHPGDRRSTVPAPGVARLDVADRVDLPGWADDPSSVLPGFDVFCLPSRSEGFPLSIVEAMLAELPVVATRVGSVGELVADDRTGLLVERDDVDGLVAALARLRDDGRLRARFGAAGRERARTSYTVEHMARAYEELWTAVRAAPRRPRLRPPSPRP